MFNRPRQRHGPYALATPSPLPSILRTVILIVVIGVALLFIGSWILHLFGAGNQLQRSAALLIVEGRGPVNVSLEGGAVQRAEDTLKLYAGDRIATGNGGHASLTLFDGTRVRLDEETDLLLAENAHGTTDSSIELELARGRAFVHTPTQEEFSGSILRTVRTPTLALSLPSGTSLLMGDALLAVFDADGLGVTVDIGGAAAPVIIGEGQQFTLPPDAKHSADLYAYRSPVSQSQSTDPFVTESRTVTRRTVTLGTASSAPASDLLTVTSPAPDALVTGSTVTVEGAVGPAVSRVRINGYAAPIDTLQGRFRQELALSNEETTEIRIEALDDADLILQEIRRVVRRDLEMPESPHITFPAKDGEIFRTQHAEFEIRGTASRDTAGIIVNDYRLQLFTPGSNTWSYLASITLKNLVSGRNTFAVSAVDSAGNRSAPVTLTILFEEGLEGVVARADQGSAASGGSASSTIHPTELPNNPPLKPGSLLVTGPTAGTQHTATGSEILIEGTTAPETASIWVNDYRLQLFQPGKETWNYIAKTAFQNLKKGRNVYKIVARDSKDQMLDTVEYRVNY